MVRTSQRRHFETLHTWPRLDRRGPQYCWSCVVGVRFSVSAFHPNFQSALTDHGAYNSESTTTPKGWATPFVPSLLGTSIVLIIGFVLWELHREAKGESVLLPMSMWTQPGAKMGSTILLVFFGWWAFNTLGYYLPLFYQEVQLYSPIQTAVHLIPSGIAVSVSNSE